MRREGVLSICFSLLLLGFCASSSTAAGLAPQSRGAALHRCPGLTAHSVEVTKVRSNFGCGKTRSVLRKLLKSGISGLPPKTRHALRWGCWRSHDNRVCNWYRSRRHTPRRVLFRAAKIKTPVVDTVQACVDIWNADGLNRIQYGYHFYADHNIRDAWVYTIPNAVNAAVLRCVVIFSVPPTDPSPQEFGSDGEVRQPTGNSWRLMNAVPELGDPVALQKQAPQHVNASLHPDGSLQRSG